MCIRDSTMAVCAEDGGYWTTCTDSEGRVVRVLSLIHI